MSVNNIKDIKNVDSENFDYLLAESNFRIESVFRQRNKRVIEPNVPMTTSIKDGTLATYQNAVDHYTPKNEETKTGGTFDFIMPANEYGLMDLRDGEFIVQAQYAYIDKSPSDTKDGIVNTPRFGNQCLMSLFQQIQLFIDDTEVQCNKWPGFSSNAEFALRYPHCKTLEEDYEIHGYNRTDDECYKLTDYIGGTATEDGNGTIQKQIDEVMKGFKNQSITIKCFRVKDTNQIYYLYTGFITQRIKLSDIFSVVDTLPPLYNHSVLIRFNRTPNNDIICNTATAQGVKCQFLGFMKFKLYQDVFVTTDQFIQTAKKYYSKPIETLITQDKQYFQPIVSKPGPASTQEFNINIDAAYKNKLITLAIPRSTNFAYQANRIDSHYKELTTLTTTTDTPHYILEGNNVAAQKIEAIKSGYSHQFDNSNTTTSSTNHYDVLKAPANSYTYGGLRSLEVVNASAGTKLYNFDMEIDGVIKSTQGQIDKYDKKSQINFANGVSATEIANYEDVYRQYVKARLHFQQSEEEALDFDTFMKEYCIYCVDLSPFDISPGDQIKITMNMSSWGGTYNPYYAYNENKKQENLPAGALEPRYVSSNIICNLFCDKVLRLLPGRQIQLADMISTSTVEVENATMA